jgi:hypothetical protein
MRGAALLCAVFALGCGSSPCRLVFGGMQPVDPGGVEGQPETVVVNLGARFTSGDCSKLRVTSVTVSLTDPNNAEVPNTVTLNNASDLVITSASVGFTPAMPGAYHLAVRFEPGLGTVQRELTVAADRSDAGEHTALGLGCDVFGLANGQPLCSGGGVLRSIGATAEIDQVAAIRFSVDEAGRVWLTHEDTQNWQLRAYTLDAGVFQPLAASQGLFAVPTQGLIARGGSAAVMDAQGLHIFGLLGDGGMSNISFEGFSTLPPISTPWCMQLTAPDQVAIANPQAPLGMSACFFSSSGTSCPPLLGTGSTTLTLGGADDDGVWWADGVQMKVLRADSEGDAGEVVSMSSSLLFAAPDCSSSQASPITAAHGFIARREPQGIVLEKYPTPAGATVNATSRYVVINDNGTWRWWDR